VTKEFERIEIDTICPVCKKNVSEIWVAKLDSVIGVRYAYICVNCKNLIKITKEKYLTAEQISQIILP
jgi:hypothetical protein